MRTHISGIAASLFLIGAAPVTATACERFADDQWAQEADRSGQPCELGDEPVTLALIDYIDMDRMISYGVNWHQDLEQLDCQRYLRLVIHAEDEVDAYRICNVEFPMDRLTPTELQERLRGLMPLFDHGDTDGTAILRAINSEI